MTACARCHQPMGGPPHARTSEGTFHLDCYRLSYPGEPIPRVRTGADLIAYERARQIEKEGWSESHDDDHADASLLAAAECYIAHARFAIRQQPYAPVDRGDGAPVGWPWHANDYKPKDPMRNLVRAGALIAAEIDRLQREAVQ